MFCFIPLQYICNTFSTNKNWHTVTFLKQCYVLQFSRRNVLMSEVFSKKTKNDYRGHSRVYESYFCGEYIVVDNTI